MSYSIIGTKGVGSTLASYFAKSGIEVALANCRGVAAVEPLAKKLGKCIAAKSLDETLKVTAHDDLPPSTLTGGAASRQN
jgi:8-hydroxy-5-deazaflavin:NADPH oxidoreductase